jgi:hypothetical protein
MRRSARRFIDPLNGLNCSERDRVPAAVRLFPSPANIDRTFCEKDRAHDETSD